jgi:hypothetical protein
VLVGTSPIGRNQLKSGHEHDIVGRDKAAGCARAYSKRLCDPPARARARPCFGTVLALKFVYYLDGKKAAMNSMPDDASILTYEKAEGNYCRLVG